MNQRQMMQLRKMQRQMEEAQEKINNSDFTGTAGGGVVSVTLKGTHEVVSVKIDPEAAKDDIEMVEDMLTIAFNEAVKKIDAETQKTLGAFGGGMGLF